MKINSISSNTEADGCVLEINDLRVDFPGRSDRVEILKGVSLKLRPGEVMGIVGESGCGKSVLARCLVRLESPGIITDGSIRLDKQEIVGQSQALMRQLRGRQISLAMQNPRSAMDPLFTMGSQFRELFYSHTNGNGGSNGNGTRRSKVPSATIESRLRRAGIASPRMRISQYPHQWSRGMLQRAQLLMAFAPGPQVVVLDEVTSALDPTIAVQMIALIRQLQKQRNTAVIFITHDIATAVKLCRKIAVMEKGAIVEIGSIRSIRERTDNSYSRLLFADIGDRPAGSSLDRPNDTPAAVAARQLNVRFPMPGRWGFSRRSFYVLRNVSISIAPGEIFCLVGESGSGKSTLMNVILGLTPFQHGELSIGGTVLKPVNDPARQQLTARWQVVFQDPVAALNPHLTIMESIEEPLLAKGVDKETRAAVARKAAEEAGLDQDLLFKRPNQASVGQNQRACIARALTVDPEMLFMDEPLSALDAIHRGKMADLLATLTRRRGLTCFLISHDLGLIRKVGTTVAVIYLGRIVEQAPAERFFATPLHPYSQALVANSRPEETGVVLAGEIPSPHEHPVGCVFHTRCPHATPICKEKAPPLKRPGDTHHVLCHLV